MGFLLLVAGLIFNDSGVESFKPWVEVMLANLRDVWDRDYVHLAPRMKKKRRRRRETPLISGCTARKMPLLATNSADILLPALLSMTPGSIL
jgi:hypothetical protein